MSCPGILDDAGPMWELAREDAGTAYITVD